MVLINLGLTAVSLFGIVIAIQQKSGGNLSEALGNLSKVLRDRKKMAEKIQAMSMEAKASAGIIGVLFFLTLPGSVVAWILGNRAKRLGTARDITIVTP